MDADIRDVARVAAVSIATVSHVINGTRYVSPTLTARVQQAMDALHYRPNSAARSLRTRQSRAIGFIAPTLQSDTSNFFFMTVAHGVHSGVRQAGFALVLANSLESIETEQEELRTFAAQMIDGIIICPVSEESLVDTTVVGDCPVVYVDRRLRQRTGSCVTADGRMGVMTAVTRLIAAGHTRIGFLSGALGVSTSNDRLDGYKQALADHGLAVRESFIKVGASTFDSGWALAESLLSSAETVTAMVVANNVLTMGAFGYVQHAGLKVPADLALIGFDDYDWTRVTTPPLTVIRQPAFEMGRKAADLLLAQIDHPGKRSKEVTLPTELIIRGSG